MNKNTPPNEVAKQFYLALSQSQVHTAWSLFSNYSQNEFLNWTLNDLYSQNSRAAQAAKLGLAEVKLMFESNQIDLLMRFWRHFARKSKAGHFARYGYYETLESDGKKATVVAKLVFNTGQEQKVPLKMFFERNGWRLGYLESKLPF